MYRQAILRTLIAQNSYLIGCAAAGEAIVIDANRDVEQYIDAAQRRDLRITHVTETHIHADFVSGSRELAHRTGARLCLCDEGDEDWKYQFDHDRKLKHGDRITIGNVTIDVLHTPGHTPEHLTFLITDGAVGRSADRRRDRRLRVRRRCRPSRSAREGGEDHRDDGGGREDVVEEPAEVRQPYPDWLQIWPGHGAGSSCGKGISAVPHSTLGYERLLQLGLQREIRSRLRRPTCWPASRIRRRISR